MMIKKFIFSFFSVLICIVVTGQNKLIDSARHQLSLAKNDTSRVLAYADLSFAIAFQNPDSASLYAEKAIHLAKQIHFVRGEIRGMFCNASNLETNGDMPEALKIGFSALEMAKKANLPLESSMCLTLIGNIFYDLDDFTKAISYYQQSLPINESIMYLPGADFWRWQTEVNFGTAFMLNNQLDSSFNHLHKGFETTMNDDIWHPVFLMFFGQLQCKMSRQDTALNFLRESIQLFENDNSPYSTSDACRIIASCFKVNNEIDSSIFYAKKALQYAQSINYKTTILNASKLLSELYESKDLKQALYYRKVFDTTNDILYGPNKVKSLQKTLSDEEDRQRKNEAERVAYQNRIKQYILLGGLFVLLLIGFILFRNNRNSKKANALLQQQKEKVENTLSELKSTQVQLIQSEKMASLGELTAGIAHEIQNPLNFVNNFSEVSNELIEELKTCLAGRQVKNYELKIEDPEIIELLNDIEQNLEKINHHGKRADAIVKGMLQHSQKSTGHKEPTDINKLCDEYLRLAYHGMRAKDKSFNAEMKTDFDESIGKINIVPQDIGRVILNLINNAFYAVNEKKKLSANGYQPTAKITTRKLNDRVEIIVADNGNGIPDKIKDKIFQPFFTTKPTGSGTGLGLSLSYDIIKAHGGEIKVESLPAGEAGKEGAGTEFIVQLPV